MPPYTIKRPRLALSCVICRRRKVKCGKEQPQCRNCERLGEICAYDTGTRDIETGRVLRAADPLESHPPPAAAPADRVLSNQEKDSTELAASNREDYVGLAPDHLSLQRGSRVRHIGRTFWGLVNGQESLGDDFFYDEEDTPADLPPPHISAVSLAAALYSLPTKPAADTLVQSFFVSVYPIHPLVDTSSFQSDYEDFWKWARAGDLHPPAKLVHDPTFTCLLFAIFYAGASVIPSSAWKEATCVLRDLDRGTTITQLKTACSDSLSACRHSEHPTLNTLVGSILIHILSENESSMEDALFIASVIRLAQSMGLHQENGLPDLDPTREQRRQIGWHIVWLDVQSSILTGLPPCLGDSAVDGMQMTPVPENSVVKLLAIGRHEAARLQNKLMCQFQNASSRNAGRIFQAKVTELVDATKTLHRVIDTLIAKIPSFDGAEDELPAQLMEASPKTQPTLYQDQFEAPSVIGVWARTSLLLVKLEVVIMLKKLLLGPPDLTSFYVPWNRIFQLSLGYLRKYRQLCRTPAFEPYAWLLAEYYGPKQCALLILIYLKHHRGSDSEQAALSCVDDYLDFMAARHGQATTGGQLQVPMTLKVLVGLRGQLGTQSFDYTNIPTETRPRNSFSEMKDKDLWDLLMNDEPGLHNTDLNL